METKKNIYEKLLNAQSKLKVPKSNFNSFGKYKYRSCEDILEAVKPIMQEEKMLLTLADEVVLIGERYYVKATATVTFDKESLSVSAYAREEEEKKGQDASQITGTASSYARKYALNGLFNIDDTKDADTDEYQKQTNKTEITKKVSLATESQIKIIKEKLSEEQIGQALDLVKKEKLEDLTIEEASSLIKKIRGEKQWN